jgi:hypothetical protein
VEKTRRAGVESVFPYAKIGSPEIIDPMRVFGFQAFCDHLNGAKVTPLEVVRNNHVVWKVRRGMVAT